MGVIPGWNSSLDCMVDYLAALADEKLVRQLIDDQLAAINAKDVDNLMKLYVSNFVGFDVKPPFQVSGADTWRKIWTDCLPYFPETFAFETRDLRERQRRSGLRALDFPLHQSAEGSPGDATVDPLTACYRKIGMTWKIVHEHCSVPFDPHTGKAVLTLDV